MSYATVEDLRVRWPAMPADLDGQAAALLADAAVRIDAYAPPSDAPTPGQAAARKTVSCEMVLYVLRSESSLAAGPGVTQATRTMGPFSQALSFELGAKTLYLTPDMKALLRSKQQRAANINLLAGRDG